MSLPARALADTSIFIAAETGREIGPLPDALIVSVATLGELEFGVLTATDAESRRRRSQTLVHARRFDPVPISERIMVEWARLMYGCRVGSRHRPVRQVDGFIAATALDQGLPIVTQDADFNEFAEVEPRLTVVRV